MTVRRQGKPVTKVLVQWKHRLQEDSMWEYYYDLKKKYLSILEDKDGVMGGHCYE